MTDTACVSRKPERFENCQVCGEPNPPKRLLYCSIRCKNMSRYSRRRMERTGDLKSRYWWGKEMSNAYKSGDMTGFLAKVKQASTVDEHGCWLYNGNMNMNGYPTLTISHKTHYAHRLVWEAANGRKTLQTIHHRCAVSSCVNPDHLEEATHRDNAAEMYARLGYEREIAALKARIAELEELLATKEVA